MFLGIKGGIVPTPVFLSLTFTENNRLSNSFIKTYFFILSSDLRVFRCYN